MKNFFRSLIIGTATGVATAYFLNTEKGKKVKAKVEKAYEAYKENPEEYHQMAKDKGYEYSNLAKDTFYDYKHKFETGELTPEQVFETVKEKANQFVQKAGQAFTENEASDTSDSDVDINLTEDDIIIDYTELKSGQSQFDNKEVHPSTKLDARSEQFSDSKISSEEIEEKVDLASEALDSEHK
ncbi:YtxH domain-containing protein [Streptococcus catagoni]|uniref:YtxH domain-containing protein n=1 Tax=Streptococcus catagoni TaxID=2654874 RepID=UPI001407942B|nr:YtxH domain-containing protein [Streptococcus catagoni]